MENDEMLRLLIENASDGIIALSSEGRVLYANEAAARNLGYARDEFLKLNIANIEAKESKAEFSRYCSEIPAGKKGGFETLYRKKDGSLIKVEVGAKVVGLNGERVAYSFFRDITESRKAETDSKSLRKQMEFILSATKAGFGIIDSKFNVRYIDGAWKKVYGDPTGKKCYEYLMDRNTVCHGCGIVKALDTKTRVVMETVLVKEDNRPIQLIVIPFQDESGEWLVAGVSVNISDRKKAEGAFIRSEQQLQYNKAKLEQKNIALGEIVAQIEMEKRKIEANIARNVNELLVPLLQRLGMKGVSRKCISLCQRSLRELTSTFGHKITEVSLKLTRREIEICNMIRGGLTSKEISNLLNVSYQTIEKHRKNIRKKFEISNKNINLVSFLEKFSS